MIICLPFSKEESFDVKSIGHISLIHFGAFNSYSAIQIFLFSKALIIVNIAHFFRLHKISLPLLLLFRPYK